MPLDGGPLVDWQFLPSEPVPTQPAEQVGIWARRDQMRLQDRMHLENPGLTSGTFRYTSRRFDVEIAGSTNQPSELYYYRTRMYFPAWGRFVQVDPIGYLAGQNLYAYVANDPLNSNDPFGLAPDSSNRGDRPIGIFPKNGNQRRA